MRRPKADTTTSEHKSCFHLDVKTPPNGSQPSEQSSTSQKPTNTKEPGSAQSTLAPPDVNVLEKGFQPSDAIKPQPTMTNRNNDPHLSPRPQTPTPPKLLISQASKEVGDNPETKTLQKALPHLANSFKKQDAPPITPTTPTSKPNDTSSRSSRTNAIVESPTSSGDSATVQIITDDGEKKPSFWFRATGSVPGTQEPIRPSWRNSQPTIDKNPVWDQPEAETNVINDPWAARRSRTGLGKMPAYQIPSKRNKTNGTTTDSFERQKPYVTSAKTSSKVASAPKPVPANRNHSQQYPISEEGEVLKEDEHVNQVSTSIKDAHAVSAEQSVPANPNAVPPHLRLQPKSVNANVSSQLKLKEPEVDNEIRSEVDKSPLANANTARNAPDVIALRADFSYPQTPVIARKSETSLDMKQSMNEDEPKSALPPHMRPMKAVAVKDTGMFSQGDEAKPLSEPSHLGSGIANVAEALSVATPEHSGTAATKGKSRAIRKPSKVTSHNGSSSKKSKRPDFPVTEYEPQLADWSGKWMAAPVGEEWDMREKYHNVDERRAALQAYAEDHAVNPDESIPAVDVNSPSFRAGKAVLDDEGIDELDLNQPDGPRFDPRTSSGTIEKANKTTAELMKGFTPKVRVSEPDPFDTYGIRSMSKEQIRQRRQELLDQRKNFVYPPNPYEPKANIYLRPAETKDVRQITDIWNHYIRTSAAVPLLEPDETAVWHDAIVEGVDEKEPFIVAVLLGDNATRDFGKIRRLKQEHIVGFARAVDLGTRRSMYRNTLELELYVQDGHQHTGA